MDADLILKQLQELEEELKCSVCSKKCVNPVKLKVCGHYFCFKCFKIKDQCLKCKAYYEEREIDYNSIAKHAESLLLELKICLLEPCPKPSTENTYRFSEEHNSGSNKNIEVNTFSHKGKIYRVNYFADTFKVNAKGETPLHVACKKRKLNEVMLLIGRKCDVNVKDFAGWTPLHEAVESGSVEIVEILLKNGVLIDTPGQEYMTPLHKAVTLGNGSLVELLLKYNADKDPIDYFGRKAIDYTQNKDIQCIFTKNITCIQRIEEIFCKEKINVYLYYIDDIYKQKLMKCKSVKVIEEYDAKTVTHFLIKKTHKLSLKIMVAMLDGCFLMPQEWIDDYLKKKYFLPIPSYIFIFKMELNHGIRKAVLNSLLKLPKLFDGILFFICGHNNAVEVCDLKLTKKSLSLLITSGGGKILHRAPTPSTCEGTFNYPYHSNVDGRISRCCHYLIYEENNPPILQYQMAEIKHRTSKWLLDCIINFTICD